MIDFEDRRHAAWGAGGWVHLRFAPARPNCWGKTVTPQKSRIFIAEDEFLIADWLAENVRALGHDCIGPVGNLRMALLLAKNETFNAAILDARLGTDRSDELADLMVTRRIPFAFCVGNIEDVDQCRWPYAMILTKPYGELQIEELIARLLGWPCP